MYRLPDAFDTKIQFHAVDFPLSHATFLHFLFSIPDRNGSTLALQKSFLPFTANISESGQVNPQVNVWTSCYQYQIWSLDLQEIKIASEELVVANYGD